MCSDVGERRSEGKREGRLFGNFPGRDDLLTDSTNGVDQVLIQVWRLKSNQVKCRGYNMWRS